MIRLCLLFALGLLQQAVSPTPRTKNPTVTKQESSQTNKQKTGGSQQAPNPKATIGKPNPAASATNPNSKQIAPGDEQEVVRVVSIPKITVARDRPAFYISLALAGVGIVGIIIAICTLNKISRQTAATEKAAEASERSIALQEVALRQWVTIENWRSMIFFPEGGGISLHVQFDVMNSTDLPLTLDYAFIMLGDQGGKAGRSNLIPPKKGHPVTTTVQITEEQRCKREQSELVFMVNGYIKFEDALEKDRTQPFSGLIGCSKTGVRFVPAYGPGLYITDEKEEKKPV